METTMLKGIVIFLKVLVMDKPKPTNTFAHRFNDDCTFTDQQQWNGGRYLSVKEQQVFNCNAVSDIQEQDTHVS